MTTIGYATLQIIPSMDGVSESIDKQLGGTLKAAGKKGSKQLADGFASGQAEFNKAAEAYAKQYDKVQDAAGKLRKEEAALKQARESGARDDRIVALEERRNKALRDQQREVKAAHSAYRDLDGAQRRLRGSSDDANSGIGRFSSTLTGAVKSGAAFAAQAAAIGGAAVLGAIAVGAATATRELYELGAQFDDVSDNMRVKTGAAGAELERLNDAVTSIARNTPAGINVIGDVVAETRRNLHLAGGDLEAVSTTITNLNRITGDQTNVRDLGKAFRAFGVDAGDQEDVLNQLYTMTTTTGLGINELIASLAKGGTKLEAFGLTAGQSAALIGSLDEVGVDIDKVIASLGKSISGFADDGLTPIQGLTQAIADIQSLPETQARDLASEIFGAKAGTDVFAAIRGGQLDIENLNAALQATPQSINDVAASTDDGAESWQKFKNNVQIALEPLANAVFDQASEGLDDLTAAAMENSDEILDFAVDFGTGLIDAVDAVAGFASGTLKILKPFSEAGGIYFSTLTLAISGVIETIADFLDLVPDWVPGVEGLRDGLHDVAASGAQLSEGMKKVPDVLDTTISAIDGVRGTLPGLRDGITELGDEMKDAAGNADDLNTGIGSLAGRTIDIKTTVNGQPANLGDLLNPGGAGTGTPGTNPLEVIAGGPGGLPAGLRPGGGGSGVGINLQLAADKPANLNDTGSVPSGPQSRLAASAVEQLFGDQLRNPIGGSRDHDTAAGTHDAGLSIDIPIGPDQMALGDQINAYLQANADTLGLKYTIWRNRGDYPNTPGTDFDQSGHMDHIDAHFSGTAPSLDSIMSGARSSTSAPAAASGMSLWDEIAQHESSGRWNDNNSGGHSTSSGAPRGGLQITDGTWNAFGGNEFAPTANLATRDQQIAVAERIAFTGYKGNPPQGLGAWEVVTQGKTPNVTTSTPQSAFMAGRSGVDVLGSTALNNAYGAGYEPGIGTPGTNEYGEPGYFEVDPRDVQDAQDRITDQYERIRESDEAARQAQVAIDELEADADQSEKDAAIERKRKADYDAGVARRELRNLELDLAEAKKGTFSPAKETPKSARGGSSGSGLSLSSSFSGFGSAIGEFAGGQIASALDVFGVPDSPGWLKGISEFIGGISVTDDAGNSIFDGGNLFGGGSAAPLSASPAGFGVPPPIEGNVHGTRAGQAPGVVYNIRTATVEDAFLAARRREDERAARPLARF